MLPLILLLVTATYANNCSYIYDGFRYTRTSILTIKGLPSNLAYNPKTKDLFFTLIDLDTLLNDNVQTRMDQYVLRNGEPRKIDNVNGQAAAYDVKNDRVYIASDTGLNVLDGSDEASFFSLKDEDIVQLYKPAHNDNLYAVFYPDNEVYVIDVNKNEKKKLEYVPCAFVLAVDAEENVYYECDSKYVKMMLKDFQEPIEFVGIAKNAARAMTVDENNRVILAANDGLYWLRPDSLIPKKLMSLDFVPSGIVLNGDDLFLSTRGIIYQFNGAQCE
ncbi:uncharacterized protein [Epargyreus clarus]|uniref:uncharacterized protein n=1 Tax=Epargyreus clarus TaxID=520877 RepID=UPI003C2C97D5